VPASSLLRATVHTTRRSHCVDVYDQLRVRPVTNEKNCTIDPDDDVVLMPPYYYAPQ